jgi:hypothetical protein
MTLKEFIDEFIDDDEMVALFQPHKMGYEPLTWGGIWAEKAKIDPKYKDRKVVKLITEAEHDDINIVID